ncbi:uncharacterized protein LOC142169096 [Nicotiana tabacum]|uniref:Uncharacterized protein LOC142169096 n=1 Tax=Nicotiana tabacum TaxID=4097 RepID=A0AC58SN61_TOBAC
MAEETIDHTHPLYLQPSDMPGLVLTPIELTGSENYGLRSRSMRLALKGKHKLGFVTGTCTKSLFNGIIYAYDARAVWGDLKERFDKVNREHVVHLQQQRMMKFLNGLNDTYDQARRKILKKIVDPTLNQAYAMITQDEIQQTISISNTGMNKVDPISLQVGRGPANVNITQGTSHASNGDLLM